MNLDNSPSLQLDSLTEDFSALFEDFKEDLISMESSGKAATLYKFGDGDYHFLNKSEVGSARPGRRALSMSYDEINHDAFVLGSLKCDYYMCELYPSNQKLFNEVLNMKEINYWAEFVYAAVATRWLTSTFAGRIGLIGAGPKLRLIHDLLTSPIYQDYLGLKGFSDYIEIPEKFACDDLEETARSVEKQLGNATSTIFLVGIGHVKSGLLWQLPSMRNAIYLDVGSGIDALAGIVERRRPFFGGWLNFRLPERDRYEAIDFLQLRDSGNVVLLKRPFDVNGPPDNEESKSERGV